MTTFQKATKKKSKLRIALEGPAGSGKTYTALAIATALCPGGLVAVLDTERGSASLYAGDPFDFVTAEMIGDYHPDRFIKAIKAAEDDGVDVLILDSITHEWKGKGGCLDLHEKATQADRNKNSYTAWAKITPLHNAFLDAINAASIHIIATMRSKTEYVIQENSRGKKAPVRVGMGAEMRPGSEFEFDIIGELDMDNTLVITKTRCSALSGGVFPKAGADVASILNDWLNSGEPPELDALALATADLEGAVAGDLHWTQAEHYYKFEAWAEKEHGLTSTEVIAALGNATDLTKKEAMDLVWYYAKEKHEKTQRPDPEDASLESYEMGAPEGLDPKVEW